MKYKPIFFLMVVCCSIFVAAFDYAEAQNINIDLSNTNGAPSNTFGAASGQPGVWNTIGLGVTSNLLDIYSASTTVGATVSAGADNGSGGGCSGDIDTLLGDNIFTLHGTWTVVLNGLLNGDYIVYLCGPRNPGVATGNMLVNGIALSSITGDSCVLEKGLTYTAVNVSVTAGTITISGDYAGTGFEYAGLAGIQLIQTSQAIHANLVIVRAFDDSLWKATCDGDTCSAFTSFPGRFSQQPSVTWDEKMEKWVVMGVASDSTIWKATFDKAGTFNNDWVRIPGSTPSPTGIAGGNLMEYGVMRVRQDGLVPAASSVSIVIPHFVPFMLQVDSEWPDAYGVAVANGMENDSYVAITYTKYNGDVAGTSAYGGAKCSENSTDTLFNVGSGSTYTCDVKCPGEGSGDHNLVIQAGSGRGCRYRVIY